MKISKKLTAVCLAFSIAASVVSAFAVSESKAEAAENMVIGDIQATAAPITETKHREELFKQSIKLSEPDETKAERFIIKFNDENYTSRLRKLNTKFTVKSVESIETEKAAGIDPFLKAEKSKIGIVELDKAVDIEAFTTELSAKVEIEYVQPDYRLELSAAEPYNAAYVEKAENGHAEISDIIEYDFADPQEYETAQAESESTVVALIDTGVDIENTDFNIFTNASDNGNDEDRNGYTGDLHGWDFVNNTASVYNAELGLEQAHGTHIAGIISQTAPNAEILPLKVFENGTAYTSDIIEAIQYANMMGADIINCSWGCTDENLALKEAIENTDMIFVCAAGNNRLDLREKPIYPACYNLDNIVSVTSVNADGGLSYFSNHGNADIAALGRAVEGIFPGGEAGTLTGTSISAGFVSGALASVYTNNEETISRLYNTADKLSNLQSYVTEGRRLNIEALLNNTVNNEMTEINPEEDFNTEGYSRTPEESWELFSALENISVKTGEDFFVVLKKNGTVWTWGYNNEGELGLGHFNAVYTPQQVPSISNVVEIAAGHSHIVARTSQNIAYAWGSNYDGCLGIGSTAKSNVPVMMTNGTNVTGIGAGANNSYVLKSGNVYTCGKNGWGAIGDGTTTKRTTLTDINLSGIKMITGNEGATFAISESGALYSWGHDGKGRLGDGGGEEDRLIPQVIIESGIVDVDMGYFDCMALTDQGEVYNWGYSYGYSPVLNTTISGVSKVVTGMQAQFVLQGNTIKSRGFNSYGSLGIGNTNYKSSFTAVSGEYVDFDVRQHMGIALGTDGYIYTWGLSNVDSGEYVTAPQKVSGRINHFAGDSFNEAAEVGEGLTYGRLGTAGIDTVNGDYYKFIPLQSSTYSIYSISSIDLVCKIYTKNSDDTYTLKFSNDDANGSMGGNYRDFCVTQPLAAGTEYYIYVYPFSSTVNGDYELNILSHSTENTYLFSSEQNDINNIYINVRNLDTFDNKVFKVIYDDAKLMLTDACIFTAEHETTAGEISQGNINIISVEDGVVLFSINRSIPFGQSLSGTINILQFKSVLNGDKIIRYEINDLP